MTISVNQIGTYFLSVSNAIGCTAIDSVVVIPNPNIPSDLNVIVVEPSCFGENDAVINIDQVVGGTEPYTYSIDGENFISFPQFFNLTAGSYDIMIEDAAGCTFERTVTVNQTQELLIDLGDDIVIQLGDTTRTLQANISNFGIVDTLIWETSEPSFDCVNEECTELFLKLNNQASYTALVIDSTGCTATDKVNVTIRKDRLIYIPSAFSPISSTGPSENDIFMINGGLGVEKINYFRIFNRWGEVVFAVESDAGLDIQPNDPNFAWDGTFRGQTMNPGVFVYVAEIEFTDGEVILYQGDVTLIK